VTDDQHRVLGSRFVIRTARWGVVAWSAIGVLLLLGIFFRFVVYPVRIIFPPLVLALIFVYALNPVVTWMKERGVPRILGALVTYVVLLGTLGIGLRFLIPVVADQVDSLSRTLPSLLARAQGAIVDLVERFGGEASNVAIDSQQVTDVAGRLFQVTLGILNGALILILGLILGFYLLVDAPKIRRSGITMVPARRRPEVLAVFQRIGRAIGGFFRGQLLVALFVGVASTLALFIVGLPFWAVVGMITGLFNLIPLIGPFIGGAIAAFIAFTTPLPTGEGLLHLEPGWPLAIGAALGLFIVQQIDNHIVSPNVVARTVNLHPVTVMLALLVGGTLMGLWGMLLAVPATATAKILTLHLWDTQATWPPEAPQDAPPPGPPPERVADPPAARRWLDRWRDRRQQQPAKPRG